MQRAVTRSITASNLTRQDYPLRWNKNKLRSFANWDPSYPAEEIDWYDEYISRHAVLSTDWIQQPIGGPNRPNERREIWGLGFKKKGNKGIVVAPLDDGSVCLWNIGFSDEVPNAQNGRILAQSKAGILLPDDNESTPHSTRTARRGILATPECVSTDGQQNKAYFAIGEDLNEVDLESLKVISRERYSSRIYALSDASHPTPLTVCTNLHINIHDCRLPHNARIESGQFDRLEPISPFLTGGRIQSYPYQNAEQDDPAYRLPLFQPTSILHLPTSSGSHDAQNGFIYVAGRIPSIMAYDRRAFSKPHGIYSGAHLCSLTAAPASSPTPTIIACGEYNGKGSLEIYPATVS